MSFFDQDMEQEEEVKDMFDIKQGQSKGQQSQQQQIQEEIYEAHFQNIADYHKGENNEKMLNEYEIMEELGTGSFGKVKKVNRTFYEDDGVTISKSFYADKIFSKISLQNQRAFDYQQNKEAKLTDRLTLLYKEIEIWKYLDHPNICKLYQIIDDPEDEKIHLIMQYCNFGQIMEWNLQLQQYDPNKQMEEFLQATYNLQPQQNDIQTRELYAKVIFKQISLGVKYLHDRNIVNRDIKLDNILCKQDCELNEHFKLSDFSTCRTVENNKYLFDCAGTPGYRAPELQFKIDTGYDGKKADIWSLGITLFTYVNLKLPFWDESELGIDIAASRDEIQFKDENSQQFKTLINLMCKKEFQERININQVLENQFFNY